MSEKVFKTHDEQLDILAERGITLSPYAERKKAKLIIQREGYYKLINGYKDPFLSQKGPDEQYLSGTTVGEIHSLYCFDRELREIFLRHILHVETNIKSLISYCISENYRHENFLIYNNFNTVMKDADKQISAVLADIQRQVSSNTSDPCIKQSISKIFKILDNDLESFLYYLSIVRNFSAHGNRLYCIRTTKPLANTNVHRNLSMGIHQNEYVNGKRDLFAAVIALRYLISVNEFKHLIDELAETIDWLSRRLNVIGIDKILSAMGFPANWKDISQRGIK